MTRKEYDELRAATMYKTRTVTHLEKLTALDFLESEKQFWRDEILGPPCGGSAFVDWAGKQTPTVESAP